MQGKHMAESLFKDIMRTEECMAWWLGGLTRIDMTDIRKVLSSYSVEKHVAWNLLYDTKLPLYLIKLVILANNNKLQFYLGGQLRIIPSYLHVAIYSMFQCLTWIYWMQSECILKGQCNITPHPLSHFNSICIYHDPCRQISISLLRTLKFQVYV